MGNKQLQVVDESGKRNTIGYVKGDTLFMPRYKSDHFFRKLNAWAIDIDEFNKHPKVKVFIVKDSEMGINYITTREKWMDHCKEMHYPPHKPQFALPLKYWEAFPNE